jgi:cell division transport system permease protein
MSSFLSSYRVFTFTAQNIVRNFWLSFITLTIFVLTLLTINAVIFLNVIADGALQAVEQKIEVTFYFTADASEDIVQAAQGYLNALDQVREVTYVSADEALASFKERHADNEVILSSIEEVGGSPFGHALVVSAHSSDDFAFISEALETPEFAPFIQEKDLTDYETIIERIATLAKRVRIGGTVLAFFFSLVAILIIFNTIRVAIYVHRDEIGIMKLVGANDWFVRGPFLLESLFYSLLAIGIIVLISFLLLGQFDSNINNYFGDIDVSVMSHFKENGFIIFGAQFVGLAFLSLLTTLFAMRRYLRV